MAHQGIFWALKQELWGMSESSYYKMKLVTESFTHIGQIAVKNKHPVFWLIQISKKLLEGSKSSFQTNFMYVWLPVVTQTPTGIWIFVKVMNRKVNKHVLSIWSADLKIS